MFCSSNSLGYTVFAVCDSPKGKSIIYYSKYKPIIEYSFWDKLLKWDFSIGETKEKIFIEEPDGWADGSSLTVTWDSKDPQAKVISRYFSHFGTKNDEGQTGAWELTPILMNRRKQLTFSSVDSDDVQFFSLYPIENVGVLTGHRRLDMNGNTGMYTYHFHMKCTISIEGK